MSLDITGHYRYPSPRPDWLSKASEEILDPDLPIVDPHHHLWTQDGNRYLLDEFADDLGSGHRIEATVFVQAHYGYRDRGPEELKAVGETEKVAAIATEAGQRGIPTAIAAGIVGFADLMLGDRVEDVIRAHVAAGEGRFRGVRHSVSRDTNFPQGIVLRPAPAGMLGDSAYRAGMARVAALGLSYDCMLYHQQIPELVRAARAVPELPIVLDHLGCLIGVGPYRGREAETLATWRRDIAELATCPNVSVKIGGLGMIICGPTWHERDNPPSSEELAEAWRPMIETAIGLFGVDRCMFESNFPVDKAMYSYAVLWNAFKRLAAGASDDEKGSLFHDTAKRFYRLG
ncbi:MAG: amidohydrolase [Rhizobiaceae bacterium]